MKNLKGWVKFNESMDETEKKCDCGQEDCDICSKEEKVEEKKKNPFAKKSKEKGDKKDTKETDKGGKKKLTAAQKRLPWNKGK